MLRKKLYEPVKTVLGHLAQRRQWESQPWTQTFLPSVRRGVGPSPHWTWTLAVPVTDSAGVSALSPGAADVAVAASDSAPEDLWSAATTADFHRTGRSAPGDAEGRPPSRC